jgi:hypothetical protein
MRRGCFLKGEIGVMTKKSRVKSKQSDAYFAREAGLLRSKDVKHLDFLSSF